MKNGLYLTDCFFIVSVLYIAFLRQIRVSIKPLRFRSVIGMYLSDYYVYFSN